jgi:Fe2+ transport system protein B
VLALNVSDSARAKGIRIDTRRLGILLGRAPVVETVGHRGRGLDRLLDAAIDLLGPGITTQRLRLVA